MKPHEHRLMVPIFEEAGKLRSLVHSQVFLNSEGSPPHEDSLTRAWCNAVKSLGFKARPTIHDLRHCWKTHAMRSGVHPLIADAIAGHGDRKKTVQSLFHQRKERQVAEAESAEPDIRQRRGSVR